MAKSSHTDEEDAPTSPHVSLGGFIIIICAVCIGLMVLAAIGWA